MSITPKIDFPVFYYKLFLIMILLAQLYPLIFGIGNWITFSFNIVLILYIVFRYYMLTKLKGDASKLSMTVTEFLILNRQQIKIITEKGFCENCEIKP
jgi:hypothetical protein